MHGRHHSSIKKMSRFMNAGRIDKDDLAFVVGVDALNSMPRGLRFIGNGGDLFADNAI